MLIGNNPWEGKQWENNPVVKGKSNYLQGVSSVSQCIIIHIHIHIFIGVLVIQLPDCHQLIAAAHGLNTERDGTKVRDR